MMLQSTSSPRAQSGAVLVVALVILLIMTLLGVSNMQSSTLQAKMANNNQSRHQAFQAAEAALAKVEFQLSVEGHDPNDFQACAAGSADCYDAQCTGGTCFSGTYAAGAVQSDCAVSTVSPPPEPYWVRDDLDVWEDIARHRTIDIDSDGELPEPKYIVEFLCYVNENPAPATACATDPNNCAPLYRITALAASRDEKAQVMLQSTYRITNL